MRKFLVYIALTLSALALFPSRANGQFKKDAFTQTYANPNDTTQRDSVDTMFSFKEFFGGVAHKRNVRIGSLFGGSTLFIGSQQIHNKQYWKLPIVYGGIGAGLGTGFYYRSKYKASVAAYDQAYAADPDTPLTIDTRLKTYSTLGFVGAGLVWWGTLMDGTINYKRGEPSQHPGRATIYSILLPGLGQIYNQEYWKVPLYWGLMAGSVHFYYTNNVNYRRYKRIHNEATDPEIAYSGPITAENALYYRDVFRRYRDWSIAAILLSYFIQVIDANVFSYMMDFQVSDDLTMDLQPTLIVPDTGYATLDGSPAVGMRLGFRF